MYKFSAHSVSHFVSFANKFWKSIQEHHTLSQLSTHIKVVHTLKKSVCGFWSSNFWKFIQEYFILSLLCLRAVTALQIYTAGNGTHVKNVKVTSICRRYYNVEV